MSRELDITVVRDALARVYADARVPIGAVAAVSHRGAAPATVVLGTRTTDGAPIDESAIFQIASMTKPVTTVVALQLIEEGRLSLNAPIAEWIPELTRRQVLAVDAEATRAAHREITVEDLLTQRSGIPYAHDATGEVRRRMESELGPPLGGPHDPDEWVGRLRRIPQSFDPGARFQYGLSTDILGVLIRRALGRGLGEVMAERVFGPLGMRDTGFRVRPQDLPRLARMYRATPDGPVDVSVVVSEPPVFESGGGGLYSTVGDYLRFLGMLRGGGAIDGVRLLSPESVAAIATNRLTPAQRALPALGADEYFATHGFGYGVAVLLEPESLPTRFRPGRGSYGWSGGFGTWWLIDPENDLQLVLMAQFETATSPFVSTGVDGGRLGHFRRRDVIAFCEAVYRQIDTEP